MAEDRCKPWMRVEKDKLKKFRWARCSCGWTGMRFPITDPIPNVGAFLDWRVHLVDCPEVENGTEEVDD